MCITQKIKFNANARSYACKMYGTSNGREQDERNAHKKSDQLNNKILPNIIKMLRVPSAVADLVTALLIRRGNLISVQASE